MYLRAKTDTDNRKVNCKYCNKTSITVKFSFESNLTRRIDFYNRARLDVSSRKLKLALERSSCNLVYKRGCYRFIISNIWNGEWNSKLHKGFLSTTQTYLRSLQSNVSSIPSITLTHYGTIIKSASFLFEYNLVIKIKVSLLFL